MNIEFVKQAVKLDWKEDYELVSLINSPFEKTISADCESFRFTIAKKGICRGKEDFSILVRSLETNKAVYSEFFDSLEAAVSGLRDWIWRNLLAFNRAIF